MGHFWRWSWAVLKHWTFVFSGAGSVVGALAVRAQQEWFWSIAAICFAIAAFLAWKDQFVIANELQQKIKPWLTLHFEQEKPPYLEVQVQEIPSCTQRYFRVRVHNVGEDAATAWVALTDCNQPHAIGIHLGHRLQVTGQPRATDRIEIAPKGDAYFDFLCEDVKPDSSLSICYAASTTLRRIARDRAWRFTLRPEGVKGGATAAVSLSVKVRGETLTVEHSSIEIAEDEKGRVPLCGEIRWPQLPAGSRLPV